MKTDICLISTVHTEKGNCTSQSLFEILVGIRPDVVFCEASPDMYKSFKEGQVKSSLELNAIGKLRKVHTCSLEVVDTYPAPEEGFRNRVNELFDLIVKDEEYANAWRNNNAYTHLYGFEYLNSVESMRIFDVLAKRQEFFIDKSNNLKYREIYTKWLSTLSNRENEMLRNIDHYLENNKLEKAVFLCGSAHRRSIMNKTKENNNVHIRWVFDLPK